MLRGTLDFLKMILESDEIITDINDGLRLIAKRDGLTFGTDAYLLSAFVRKQTRARAVDLGSGTGIIPMLLLAKGKLASVEAVELQPDFAALITRNAELNQLSDRLHAHCTDVRMLTPERFGGTVDVVLSNPPYMHTGGKANLSERKNIARHEIAGGIGDFCDAASCILKYGGLFYTVFRPDRLCDLMDALRRASLEVKRMTVVHARAELPPCLVLCESKKGAAPGLYVTPPLIMYTHGEHYTDTLSKIYETGEFDEHYNRP